MDANAMDAILERIELLKIGLDVIAEHIKELEDKLNAIEKALRD